VERWTDFAVIIGGGFAALLGLLFVAISIKADIIRRSSPLRARATQTMIFLMPLLAAAILGIPRQALWVFGALVLTLGIVQARTHLT
jgi:energy-converting hydrogenase Eha subunit A